MFQITPLDVTHGGWVSPPNVTSRGYPRRGIRGGDRYPREEGVGIREVPYLLFQDACDVLTTCEQTHVYENITFPHLVKRCKVNSSLEVGA